MATLRGLMREAGQTAKWRGHVLRPWLAPDRESVRYTACSRCGRIVVVNITPMPNDIDTSGDAVALDCGDTA